jgi:cellulose biosynthesis protein BcsQ
VGTTSITAALAWALQLLGETVLAIDASPDNMLRFFSTSISHRDGWARALLDGATGATPAALYLAYRSFAVWSALARRKRER